MLTRTHDFSITQQVNYTKSEQVDKFDGNAILLIRNPFRAIMSNRAFWIYHNHQPVSLNESYIQEKGNEKGFFFFLILIKIRLK